MRRRLAVLRTMGVGLLAGAIVVGVLAAAQHQPGAPLFVGTVTVGHNPTIIALDDRRDRAIVLNETDATVSVVDTARGTVVRTIGDMVASTVAVDVTAGHTLVLSAPSRRPGALRGIYSQPSSIPWTPPPGSVLVIDTGTGDVVRRVDVGHGASTLAIDASTGRAFVANSADDTVSVLDTRSGRVMETVAVGYGPRAVAVDEDIGRVFTANHDDNTVSVLDARTGSVLRTTPVGSQTQHPVSLVVDAWSNRVAVGTRTDDNTNGSITLLNARTGSTVLIGTRNIGLPWVADDRTGRIFVVSFYHRTLSLLDARTGAIDKAVGWPHMPTMLDWQHTAAADPRTGLVYIATMDTTVNVLDGWTGRTVRVLSVGRAPNEIAVASSAKRVVVANFWGGGARWHDPWSWLPSWARQWLPWLPRPIPPHDDGRGTLSVIDTTQ